MMVQDRKTGQWYDPDQKMKELFAQKWFQDIMKRLKER